MWIFFAIFSAICAGLTSILAKCGIRKTDTDVATALRTIVMLLFSWAMVLIVGSQNAIGSISTRSWMFLIFSGVTTGACWMCYFTALSLGDINKVVPIDKSSTVLSVLLAITVFQETENLAIKLVCTVFLAVGILLMVEKTDNVQNEVKEGWLLYAVLSPVFASATTVLSKLSVDGVESNLATAIRTLVACAMSWAIVFTRGKQRKIKTIDKKELGFIGLSGCKC